MLLPSDRAMEGMREPPKSTRTMIRKIISSCVPIPNIDFSLRRTDGGQTTVEAASGNRFLISDPLDPLFEFGDALSQRSGERRNARAAEKQQRQRQKNQ